MINIFRILRTSLTAYKRAEKVRKRIDVQIEEIRAKLDGEDNWFIDEEKVKKEKDQCMPACGLNRESMP